MSLNGRIGTAIKVLAALLATLVVISLGAGFYLYRLTQTLPSLDAGYEALQSAQTSFVYAADGSLLAQWHRDEDRIVVSFQDMPADLRNAVVAIEDRRFYEHNGVDPRGVLRAARANTSAGSVQQGGSTITQQLAKVLFTDGERSLTRKLREVLLAYELEVRVDKDQVLEAYLNTVYYGNGAYGVESAARSYFGKRTTDLTLHESALLAGLIQSPSRVDPTRNPEAALKRRNVVLVAMRELGYITRAQERAAAKEPIVLAPPERVAQMAPHFVEYVKQDLIARLGEKAVFEGGLKVHTTLDPELQRIAEKSARVLAGKGDPEVAIVSVRYSDGAVLAMVGGRDFSASQFNLAVQGRRQPGSAFKTFVLVTALEQGIRPDEVFSARPYSVEVKDGVWNVQNYENARTEGSLTLQAATNWSVNTVYARLITRVGTEKVAETAHRLGIETPIDPNPAIALGGLTTGVSPLEMAGAYGTLANSGLRISPSGVERVLDGSGEVVYEPDRAATRALSKDVAVQASLMLHEVVENGTGSAAAIPLWAAGKTGTTQSNRDAWFVGWAGGMSTAVWVGYPDAQIDMTDVHGTRVTGGSFPAQIWSSFMAKATETRSRAVTPSSEDEEPPPMDRIEVRICQGSMRLANSDCEQTVDIYLHRALVPKDTCELH